MTDQERISYLEGQLTQALAFISEFGQIKSQLAHALSQLADFDQTKSQLAIALARIAELESLLSKVKIVKNSQNSHLPPSLDITRKNQSLRVKSDKPVGGQLGHKGHTLKMSDTPDKIVELRPEFCNLCGSSIDAQSLTFQSRRQMIEIPKIFPQTIEYRSLGATCTCGHHQCGSFPAGVENHIQYGPNIQSLVIYQSYYQFLPFGRLSDFFRKVCHVDISKGTIENIIRRNAEKAQFAYARLQGTIAISYFVGSDETGYKLNTKKGWFWVWQNAMITFIVAAQSRSKQVIEQYFPDGFPNATLCTDRLAAQLSTLTKWSQICLSHLLRDLAFLIDRKESDWPLAFKTLLKEAISLKQAQSQYKKDDPKTLKIEQKLDELLNNEHYEALMREPEKYKNAITFFKQMRKLRGNIFPFLYDERVPYDNNSSERAIRMIKVKMKVSGQFKSLQQEFAVLRSVIDTTIKNGMPVFEAIQALVNVPLRPAG
jgi:transposase